MNVKPVIWNNNAYLFNTTHRYAIVNSKQTVLYTEEEYRKNCFEALESVYCKTSLQEMNDCFNKIIHNKFERECFIRLKNQNMITQIGEELYFTVFSPFDIIINRNSVEQTVHINESSKIVEKIRYNITTPFFNFMTNKEDKYEIFYDNKTNEFIADEPREEHRMLILSTLILFCFLARLMYCYFNQEQ